MKLNDVRSGKSLLASLVLMTLATGLLTDSLRLRLTARTPAESGGKQEEVDALDRTLRAHYVRLDRDNRLSGLITAIDQSGKGIGVSGLDVSLVQKGNVIARATTEADGSFLTPPLAKGNYTFCVSGAEGFLAYGLHVVDPLPAQPGEVLPLPGAEETPVVPPSESVDGSGSVSISGRLVLSPVSWQEPAAQASPVENLRMTAAVIPPEFKALRRILSDYAPSGFSAPVGRIAESRINVEKSLIVGGFDIALGEDGRLEGRIAQLTDEPDQPIRLQEMNAFLIRDDEIFSRVIVKEDGNFVFNDIDPGVYGFVAAGKDGFAAISFRAVIATDESNGPETKNASTAIAPTPKNLQVALCPPEDTDWLRDRVEELNRDDAMAGADGMFGPDMPMGAPFGGMSGGYGGYGFGGPLGGDLLSLAEAGLAGWAIYELVDGVDDAPVTPQPVSPTGNNN